MMCDDGYKRPEMISLGKIIQVGFAEFAKCGQRIEESGLAVGSGGNMSIRAPGGILVTSTGSKLSDLKIEDIIFVSSADGEQLYYFGSKKPSSETVMHWTIYQVRPEIQAVSHVNVGPKDNLNILTSTKEIAYGTYELAQDTSKYFKISDTVMLKNHGVIAVGGSLTQATDLLIEATDKNKPYVFAPGQTFATPSST